MTTGATVSEETLVRRNGETVILQHDTAPVYDAAGKMIAAVGTSTDVTARKKTEAALHASEQRFRQLAETVPGVVFRFSEDGATNYVNQRFIEYTGFTLEDLARDPLASIHPDDRPGTESAWAAALQEGRSFERRFRMRARAGGYRWFLCRSQPVIEAGRATAWVGCNIDIDDLVRAEEALKEADRRKDEFLAILAHELRNPLASVRSATELLAGDVDAARVQRVHAVLERQSRLLVKMIDDLLDVSRITHGKVHLQKQRLNAVELARAAAEGAADLLRARNHELRIDLPRDPLFVDADPARLLQVIGNLLHNAAKYTPPGGQLGLSVERAGRDVAFRVRDNGIGIPADALDRIFEMFAQLGRGTDGAPGGLGIGLTVVKELVEMHGGGVTAASDGPNRGAEFVVTLPEAASSSLGDTATSDAARAARGEAARRRVLVVDDNVDAAEMLAEWLRDCGHDVEVAHAGEQALDMVRALPPDVVLLDLGLPEMDGYEVARRLRSTLGAGTRLIAVTGYGQAQDRDRSRRAGFDHHMVKPVDVHALETLLVESA